MQARSKVHEWLKHLFSSVTGKKKNWVQNYKLFRNKDSLVLKWLDRSTHFCCRSAWKFLKDWHLQIAKHFIVQQWFRIYYDHCLWKKVLTAMGICVWEWVLVISSSRINFGSEGSSKHLENENMQPVKANFGYKWRFKWDLFQENSETVNPPAIYLLTSETTKYFPIISNSCRMWKKKKSPMLYV